MKPILPTLPIIASVLLFAVIAACSDHEEPDYCDTCPHGEMCNPAGICTPTCETYRDCHPCQECEEGFCAPSEHVCSVCSATGTCPGGLICVNDSCLRCVPERDDEACAAAYGGAIYRCNDDGLCGLPSCEEGSDCHEWRRVCTSGYCWPCEEMSDCEEAGYPEYYMCLDGECADPGCIDVSVAPTAATAAPTSICAGGSSTLNVVDGALGKGASWQWYTGSCGGTQAGTGAPLEVSPPGTTQFFVRAEGECNTTSCASVSVEVSPLSLAGTASASVTDVCYDGTVVLTVSGQEGSVQWQSSTDGGAWGNVPGATTETFVAAGIRSSVQYRARVTSGGCPPAYTDPVAVTMWQPSLGGTASTSKLSVCQEEPFDLSVADHRGDVSWQWSTEAGVWNDLDGATTSSYTVGSVSVTTRYRARVKSGTCEPSYSNVVEVEALSPSIGGVVSASSQEVCSGGSSVLTVTGHNGQLQWQSSADSVTWVDIAGATSEHYTATNLTSSRYFRVRAETESCSAVFSDAVHVSVSSLPAGGTASAEATTVCTGASATLNVTDVSGAIQWQTFDGSDWSDIAGATGSSYATPALTAATRYRVKATSGSCAPVYSNEVQITVNQPPVAGTVTSSEASVCPGEEVTLTIAGHSGSVQWQMSTNGTTWSDISGATASTYKTTLTADRHFRARVSRAGCDTATTNTVTVYFRSASVAPTSATASSTRVCSGTTVTLSRSGGSLGHHAEWRWYSGSCGGTGVGTGSSIQVAPTTTTTYYVRAEGTCNTTACRSVTVQVDAPPVTGTASASSCLTAAGVAAFTDLTLTGHTGSIQWQVSSDNVSWTDIEGATSETHNYLLSEGTTYFRARVTSGVCSAANTSSVSVHAECTLGYIQTSTSGCWPGAKRRCEADCTWGDCH